MTTIDYDRTSIAYITNVIIVLLALCCANLYALHLTHDKATRLLNESFLVNCKDKMGRPVRWSGPRGALGSKTRPRVVEASYGTSIQFEKLSLEDSGTYTCAAGDEKKTMQLIVEVPVKFMDTQPVQIGLEYEDITLRCEVKGGDRMIVTWSVEDGDIVAPKFQKIADGLLIRNASRYDPKVYTCKAMQTSTGDISEQQIQLHLHYKPELKPSLWEKDEPVWGFIGGVVNLTCEVEAYPHPKFEWRRGRNQMSSNRYIHIVTENNTSVLQLNLAQTSMYGNYMCAASNKYGTIEKIFNVQKGVRALPPDFIELKGENADLIDIGIHGPKLESSFGLEPQGYMVEYRIHHPVQDEAEGEDIKTNEDHVSEEEHDEDGDGVGDNDDDNNDDDNNNEEWNTLEFEISEANSYPIRNLQHDTTYEIRVATRNAAGLSAYTNVSYFKTLASVADSSGCIHPALNVLFIFAIFLFMDS